MDESRPSILWDLNETCRQLGGVSKSTVRRLIQQGDLASCRVGNRLLRVLADSVRAYVENHTFGKSTSEVRGGVMPANVVVMPVEAQNSPCAESVACREIEPCHTDARIHRIGGSNTPTQAGNQLTNLLAQLTLKKQKHSKQNGVLRRISKGSGALSPNTLSRN